MAKRPRKSYTAQKRAEILSAATKDNMTANEVHKRFGVTPVTYYSWRKKQGLVGRRGRRPSLLTQVGADSAIAAQVRDGVQNKVRAVLPGIVREEVNRYLTALFAAHAKMPSARK